MSSFFIETIIKVVVVMLVFTALGGFSTYIERKILGFFQRRLGPTFVGPFGLLQLAADGLKLFTKEDVVPQGANRLVFSLAPVISICSALVSMSVVPFFPDFEIFGYRVTPIISDINVGLLFFMSVGAVGIYAPLLAGLSSGSKWSLIGGARACAQILSFEVIAGLSVLPVIMVVGSLSLVDMNGYQSGGIFNWLLFKQPVAFILFVIASYAELNRTPFDLLEMEAEMVAGYCTEYSGLKWGMFFIGEYAHMFAFGFVVSLIFLGGFNPIWIIPGGVAIILKVCFFIFLFMWVRATYPHVRPDQLMGVCWHILMPIALLNVFLTGVVML